jgi:L-galactose dehydrogenase
VSGAAGRAVATFVRGFHDPDAVARMPYRVFGSSGRVVSAFSYGASALGGVFSAVSDEEGVQVVHEALRSGVNLIDVAPWYGFGKAEEVLGQALRTVPRSAYYLHTKVRQRASDAGVGGESVPPAPAAAPLPPPLCRPRGSGGALRG